MLRIGCVGRADGQGHKPSRTRYVCMWHDFKQGILQKEAKLVQLSETNPLTSASKMLNSQETKQQQPY